MRRLSFLLLTANMNSSPGVWHRLPDRQAPAFLTTLEDGGSPFEGRAEDFHRFHASFEETTLRQFFGGGASSTACNERVHSL